MEDSASSAQSSIGSERDADIAGVTVETMDQTAITNFLLLSHRKGFFVRSNLTLILKHLGTMMTFLESSWALRWIQEARREESQVIQTMGVWVPIPKNEK